MPSQLRKIYVGSRTFEAGGTATLEIPRNHCISALRFLVVAQVDRASGSDGTCMDSAPAQLVKELEVQLNGKNTLKRMSLARLHRVNQIRHHVRPFIYAQNLKGYSDLSNDVSKVMAQFDFERPRSERSANPTDTVLDPRGSGITSLDLNIAWGNANDIMDDTADDGSMTITVDSAKLHVWALVRVGMPSRPRPLWKESMVTTAVTATGEQDLFSLPVNTAYDMLTLFSHADGDLVDTIIPFGLANTNMVEIYSGTDVYHKIPAGLMQYDARIDFEVEEPERLGSSAALNHGNQNLTMEGVYPINFINDGLLSEALDTSGLPDCKMKINVGATPGTDNKIDLYKSEIVLPVMTTTTE